MRLLKVIYKGNELILMIDVFFESLYYQTMVVTTTGIHLSNELVFTTHEFNHSFFSQLHFLLVGEWKYCLLHK